MTRASTVTSYQRAQHKETTVFQSGPENTPVLQVDVTYDDSEFPERFVITKLSTSTILSVPPDVLDDLGRLMTEVARAEDRDG